MPDDRQPSGGSDRTRIRLDQEHEVRDWARVFGVTPEVLREAVKAVGDQSLVVEEYLRVHGHRPHYH